MNVRELKEIIADLPDAMEVYICDLKVEDLINMHDAKLSAVNCLINQEENFVSIQHIDLPKN